MWVVMGVVVLILALAVWEEVPLDKTIVIIVGTVETNLFGSEVYVLILLEHQGAFNVGRGSLNLELRYQGLGGEKRVINIQGADDLID